MDLKNLHKDIHVNWLNLVLAVALACASAFAMNWRDWHPDVFTGRSLIGFVLLAIGAFVVGIVGVMSIKGESKWTTPVALVLGVIVGVSAVLFFQSADISWPEALAGIGVFVVIGGLIAGITLTKWKKR
jgi:peptidoglycan/LPS O-acetylase OafA/YrhL